MIKELAGVCYVSTPDKRNLCIGCAAYDDTALCDALGSTCVDHGIIWTVGTQLAGVKSILIRIRPLVEGLTKITDMPSGEDLQLLRDIDKVLENLV